MALIIDDYLLEEIKDRVDLIDFIGEYVDLKKSGSNYMGLCPFHNEKTPSFSVSPSKGIFHCFGCGAGGDQITFAMKIENLNFVEAVKFLADRAQIEIKEKETTSYDKKIADEKERCYQANKDAALFYLNNLRRNKIAYSYLTKRDIDPETIKNYGLGFAENSWDGLYKYLKNKGYKDEELYNYNLISKSKNGNYIDRFRNRIIFPIIDTNKRVIGFGGRVIDDSMPKYLNTKDTIVFNKGRHLYNLNIIANESKERKIILVEGYMDVISLYKSGINYSVASLGTSLTLDQAGLIKRYADDVYICYDSDDAGINATKRAIDILISKDIHPKIISLPDRLDPDDYIRKYGKLSFELEIKNAISYIDYKILKIKENYNIESAEGLSNFTSEIAKVLSRIKNPIEMDVYVSKIAKDYQISKESILSYIKSLNINKNKKEFKKQEANKKRVIEKASKKIFTSKRKRAEDYLIRFCMDAEENYRYAQKFISSYEFSDAKNRIIFESLDDLYKQMGDHKDLIDKITNYMGIEIEKLEELLSIDIEKLNFSDIKDELILTIKDESLKTRRIQILEEIKSIESTEQTESTKTEINYLLKELDEINKKIQSF